MGIYKFIKQHMKLNVNNKLQLIKFLLNRRFIYYFLMVMVPTTMKLIRRTRIKHQHLLNSI